MNELQARTLREAHDVYVRSIHKLPKAILADLLRAEQADRGIQTLYGGPSSKDELISALVELRYPRAKMNESLHVLYHQDFMSEVCEFCKPDPCPMCGALQGHCKYSNEYGGTVNGRHVWDLAKPATSARLNDA